MVDELEAIKGDVNELKNYYKFLYERNLALLKEVKVKNERIRELEEKIIDLEERLNRKKVNYMNLKVLGIVIPHTVKVAFFIGISAGLTFVLNNIAQLHLTEMQMFVLMAVINAILAGIKKYIDEA